MSDPLDFEARAAELLPELIRDYFATGAGSQATLGEAAAAWSAVRFRPRVLTDVSSTTVSTTVLGSPVQTPVLIAPMAQQLAAHPEGEVAMGLAAGSTGSLLGVSTHTAVRFADIAATGCLWWFQVYLMRDRGVTELLVRRAIEHGARAIVLTADMVALLPSAVNPRDWPDGPAKARHTNLTADELSAAGTRGLQTDPSTGLDAIGWLHEISGLPVLVKGVLRGDDARRCVDAGAEGLVVVTVPRAGRRLRPSGRPADRGGGIIRVGLARSRTGQ
jgi:4-hydroxymandelate oxidase